MRDFIELHDLNGELITIFVNCICAYYKIGTGTSISLVNGRHFTVQESPKEIKCAIIDTKYSVTPRHL